MAKRRWGLARRSRRRPRLPLAVAVAVALAAACIPAPVVTNAQVRTAIRRCWNPTSQVWLTFDDGGPAANVNGIIDVLVRNNVRARFFPVGTWAQSNPWLIARMELSGQEIGNHTYNHADFNTLSTAQIGWEIDHGVDNSPDRVKLVRPPDGDGAFTQRISNVAAERGYHVCFWTVDTRDWSGISASAIISAVRYGSSYTPPVYAGGTVLMHMQAPHTLQALQGVIDGVRARGLQLVSIH